MNIILFDDKEIQDHLLPLTYTRPVGALRVGILTIAEKWEKHLNGHASFHTRDYLKRKYPLSKTDDNFFINGAICPNQPLIEAIKELATGQALVKDELLIAARTTEGELPDTDNFFTETFNDDLILVDKPWKIFKLNAAEIRADFDIITKDRTSARIEDPHTIVYGKENVFIEEGAKIKAAVLNAERGPIYIGKNAEINEGAIIRGSFALCEGSIVNMGAKMRGDSTIGPFSKVGGEVTNSVIQGYSNKSHEGYLGNSVLGEWCNLGADTNTSNLKNNYVNVKLWSYAENRFVDTGETFCGLIMGDHSKSSINMMFNTGTVVGVSSNIFGAGFPRTFIPSFAWGGQAGFTTYRVDKALEVAEVVMERRNKILDDQEKAILQHIYDTSEDDRFWEKK